VSGWRKHNAHPATGAIEHGSVDPNRLRARLMSRIQCTSFSSVVSLPVTAVHGATPAPARHSPQRRRLCARPRAVGQQARRRQPPHRRPLPLVPRARLRGTSRDLDLQSAPNQRNTPAIAYACWVARRPRSRQRVDEGTSARSRQGSSAAAIGGPVLLSGSSDVGQERRRRDGSCSGMQQRRLNGGGARLSPNATVRRSSAQTAALVVLRPRRSALDRTA